MVEILFLQEKVPLNVLKKLVRKKAYTDRPCMGVAHSGSWAPVRIHHNHPTPQSRQSDQE